MSYLQSRSEYDDEHEEVEKRRIDRTARELSGESTFQRSNGRDFSTSLSTSAKHDEIEDTGTGRLGDASYERVFLGLSGVPAGPQDFVGWTSIWVAGSSQFGIELPPRRTIDYTDH